ncbi:NAD-dependent epimerase/dehydratase family protein [Sphingoaurantiacus capsulatus]|uniref:NAD-dependent epimerase/dehydratase family protein n=1 Tax=Sphingoaurantiacus capsulatus TaxID=1771310 RepID=A0ABV7X8S2_9SPHN
MKIVVTGGAGMIGSNLCARLLSEGHDVVAIDNLWRGSLDNLRATCGDNFDKLAFLNADLSAISDWAEALRDADCVYHLADIVAGIGYVFTNESSIFRKNLLINASVATAAEMMRVKRYVYVGTACSFPLHLQSGVDAAPLKESDQFPAHPESAYGWSKLMGELDAGYMAKYAGIETVTLVFHNVYGTPCDYKSNRAQALPAIAYRALQGRQTGVLDVWGDGTQGRAFVHVDDIVDALVMGLSKGAGAGPIQIGPNVCTSIGDAARTIVGIVDPKIDIRFDASKPVGDKGRCADYSKATEVLGWKPTVTLEKGLRSMVDWIAAQEGL